MSWCSQRPGGSESPTPSQATAQEGPPGPPGPPEAARASSVVDWRLLYDNAWRAHDEGRPVSTPIGSGCGAVPTGSSGFVDDGSPRSTLSGVPRPESDLTLPPEWAALHCGDGLPVLAKRGASRAAQAEQPQHAISRLGGAARDLRCPSWQAATAATGSASGGVGRRRDADTKLNEASRHLAAARAVERSRRQLQFAGPLAVDHDDMVQGLGRLQERLLSECRDLCLQCQDVLVAEDQDLARLNLALRDDDSSTSDAGSAKVGSAALDTGSSAVPSPTAPRQPTMRRVPREAEAAVRGPLRTFVARLRVAQRLSPALVAQCDEGGPEVLRVVDDFVASFGRAVELLVAMRLVSVMEAPFATQEEVAGWEALAQRLPPGSLPASPCDPAELQRFSGQSCLLAAARLAAQDLEEAYAAFHTELGNPSAEDLRAQLVAQAEAAAAATVASAAAATAARASAAAGASAAAVPTLSGTLPTAPAGAPVPLTPSLCAPERYPCGTDSSATLPPSGARLAACAAASTAAPATAVSMAAAAPRSAVRVSPTAATTSAGSKPAWHEAGSKPAWRPPSELALPRTPERLTACPPSFLMAAHTVTPSPASNRACSCTAPSTQAKPWRPSGSATATAPAAPQAAPQARAPAARERQAVAAQAPSASPVPARSPSCPSLRPPPSQGTSRMAQPQAAPPRALTRVASSTRVQASARGQQPQQRRSATQCLQLLRNRSESKGLTGGPCECILCTGARRRSQPPAPQPAAQAAPHSVPQAAPVPQAQVPQTQPQQPPAQPRRLAENRSSAVCL